MRQDKRWPIAAGAGVMEANTVCVDPIGSPIRHDCSPCASVAILILSPNPKGFRLNLQLKSLCKGKSAIDNPAFGNP
jgi:hypothetical protein